MTFIKVVKEIGDKAIDLNQGNKIRSLVEPALKQKNYVAVSFEEVTIYAAPFFAAAFGQLYKSFSYEVISDYLLAANMTQLAYKIYLKTMKNCRQYYLDPKHRATVEQVFREISNHEHQ